MKQNKLAVIAIVTSVLLVIVAIFVYFIINPQSSTSENTNGTNEQNLESKDLQTQTEELTDENLANEIENENGNESPVEQRSIEDLDSTVVQEIKQSLTTYISGRYAPINEEEYNIAMGMHSPEIISNYDFDYQNAHENSYALNEDKDVKDVVVEVESIDENEVIGNYSFNLVVDLSDDTEKIEHEGEFTLSTYENGYLYLSKFGDTSE